MYQAKLSVKETQHAIKLIKVFFEKELGDRLNLLRVSAPLFVRQDSGLNDGLNEVERPVHFDVLNIQEVGEIEVVHSLAKWKRVALQRYGFEVGEGLYANMNAIRRDEEPDELHSIYVDQWDFEKIMPENSRHFDYLKEQVNLIYSVFRDCEVLLHEKYPQIPCELPETLTFITSEELLQLYPEATPKERENAITKKYGAVFVMQIGGKLSDGTIHDGRAADYDDWLLNGDLLFYNHVLDSAIELSSMGIRVNPERLQLQLEERGQLEKATLPYHAKLLAGELPQTFGGGIGQSRICQYLLKCYHIGEVQCSIWPHDVREKMKNMGVTLL